MARKISTCSLSQQVLSVWLNYWLEAYAKPNVTKSTYYGYRRIVETHIIPEIGEIRLCELSTKLLQSFFNKLAYRKEKLLSQKSVKNIYDVLHVAINTAVETKIIERNNLESIILPKCGKRAGRFLTYKEQNILISALKKQKNINLWN